MNKYDKLMDIRQRLTQIYLELGNPDYVKADSVLNQDMYLLKQNDVISADRE